MKIWRRIVSVLAGTMIAAGGIVAASAVIDFGPATTSGPPAVNQGGLDLSDAQAVTRADANEARVWLNQTATAGSPTVEDRTTAAIVALDLAELDGQAPPNGGMYGGASSTPPPPSSAVLQTRFNSQPQQTMDDTAAVVCDPDTGGATAPQLSTGVVLRMNGISSLDTESQEAFIASCPDPVRAALFVTVSTADAYADTEPSDALGLKASVSDPPPAVANWTAAALEEIRAREAAGTLENDTLNISLASQALRPTDPATADALNAELRFRQAADGSFGDIRSTAEAARALAIGSAADRLAATRAITWLDNLGPLTGPEAALRLRAHAYDGMLYQGGYAFDRASGGNSETPAPAAAMSAPLGGRGALALLLIAGGIGLSLSLVTTDALKGSRQRLYDTVRASPGLHVNELRRRLHMSPSSIEYHLSVLVGAGLVIAEDDGRYRRFYANGAGLGLNPRAPMSRNTLGALRRPHAVALVRALADRGAPATARELARSLSLHESAVARRLAHLEDAGVLASERQGRSRFYRLADPGAAMKALAAVEEAPPVLATTGAPAVPLEAEAPSPLSPAGALHQ